jgi:hypothetical protein
MQLKHCAVALCLLALAAANPRTAVAAGGGLPSLQSQAGDPLSDSDRTALAAWVFAQPGVQAHIGQGRTRLLRMGADLPKDASGEEYRRATFFVRNYDAGVVHAIRVHLVTGQISIDDLLSAVQPNPEEIAAALAVIRRDPELATRLVDPAIHVTGGFYARSPRLDDPCSRDVCLLIELMNAGHGNGFANRVVVNLSSETVANRNFRSSPDPEHPVSMTDLGGN